MSEGEEVLCGSTASGKSSSTCALCGKEFKWYWRWRYNCFRCHRQVCSNCYRDVMIPEKIRIYDYEEYPICRECVPAVQKEMEEPGILQAALEYRMGLRDGEEDGLRGSGNKANISLSVLSVHYVNGYKVGHNKGAFKHRVAEGIREAEMDARRRRSR